MGDPIYNAVAEVIDAKMGALFTGDLRAAFVDEITSAVVAAITPSGDAVEAAVDRVAAAVGDVRVHWSGGLRPSIATCCDTEHVARVAIRALYDTHRAAIATPAAPPEPAGALDG